MTIERSRSTPARALVLAALLAGCCGCAADGADGDGAMCTTYDNGCTCAPFVTGDGSETCTPEAHGELAYCCEYDHGDGSDRDDGAYGIECVCLRPTCLQSPTVDVCSCDPALYSFDLGGEEVDACKARPGEVCCLETTADGTACYCVGGGTQCPGGAIEVAACDPTMVSGCHEGGSAIATCE